MKIRTLLICFLALSSLALSSCKKTEPKEKYGRYSEDFVGEYSLTVTPSLTTFSDGGEVQSFPISTLEDVPCIIDQCDKSNNGVHIYVGRTAQNINFIGNCDENGMYIYEGIIKTKIETEEYGELELDLVMPTTSHIEAPVNSYISMQTPVDGYVTYFMENDTVAITSKVLGEINVSGIKLVADDE